MKKIVIVLFTTFLAMSSQAADPCNHERNEAKAKSVLRMVDRDFSKKEGVTGLGVSSCTERFFQDLLSVSAPDILRDQKCGVKVYLKNKAALIPFANYLRRFTENRFELNNVIFCAEVVGVARPESL